MKRPMKIIISLVIIAGVIGIGLNYVNKTNEEIYQRHIQSQPKAEVKKGNIVVAVTSSGNIELSNSESDDMNNLKVVTKVDELDINKIKKNQDVDIILDAFPNEVFKGKVIDVAETGEVENGKAKYKVEISLPKSITEVGNINKDEVNLRKGSSTEFELIKVLNKDTKVNILNKVSKSKNEKWYQVSLEDGTTGWVHSSNVNISGINNPDIESTIKNNTVNIKKSTSSKSKVLTKLVKDDTVQIIGKENDYYKVKLSDGREGYIKEDEVITEKLKPGMSVTASIIINNKENALYLPIECVVKTDDGYVVVMSDTNKSKKIKVGINSEDYIEVVEGLSKGDTVKIIGNEEDSISISEVENKISSNED